MNYLKSAIYILLFLSCFEINIYANTLKLNPRDSVEMKMISAGDFLRGSKLGEGRLDEQPQKTIYLDSYYIDIYEVSNGRYLKFIKETERKDPPNPYGEETLSNVKGIQNYPIVQVTWYDAVDYCRWAGKRLPTEAEWEKAARGNEGFIYPWGSKPAINSIANFQKQWEEKNTFWPVNYSNGNDSPYGLVGMSGNAREWVQDWYSPDYYKDSPIKNPKGPSEGILKVIKGGSWHSFKSDLRIASRGKGGFALKTDGIGFRCAK
jgi:formylglycine-generating enzyme required for sulfatase activity